MSYVLIATNQPVKWNETRCSFHCSDEATRTPSAPPLEAFVVKTLKWIYIGPSCVGTFERPINRGCSDLAPPKIKGGSSIDRKLFVFHVFQMIGENWEHG